MTIDDKEKEFFESFEEYSKYIVCCKDKYKVAKCKNT